MQVTELIVGGRSNQMTRERTVRSMTAERNVRWSCDGPQINDNRIATSSAQSNPPSHESTCNRDQSCVLIAHKGVFATTSVVLADPGTPLRIAPLPDNVADFQPQHHSHLKRRPLARQMPHSVSSRPRNRLFVDNGCSKSVLQKR